MESGIIYKNCEIPCFFVSADPKLSKEYGDA